MRKFLTFLLLFLIFVYTNQNQIGLHGPIDKKHAANSVYFIMAPRVIRPGRSYEVSISIKDTFEMVPINLMIKKDNQIILRGTAIVTQDNPKTIKFQVPSNATAGLYTLSTFASSPTWKIAFYNETFLEFHEKTTSLFIQTDKAIYKSGQKVNFRIFALDQDLKPYPGPVNVVITDAKRNRIQQWNNQSNEYGVISNCLELSDQPVLGQWSITATVKNVAKVKEFSVDEYVLPKFQVTIDVPKYTLFADEKIIAILRAHYTFGKPVTGHVEIITQINIYGQIIVMQNMDINDGRAVIEIPMKHFKRNNYLNPPKQASATITAYVTESATNITQNENIKFNIYSSKIKIDIIKTSESFKPGLSYTFLVLIHLRDGSPLPGINNSVNIATGFTWETVNMISKLYPIPPNGLVQVDINIALDAREVRIKAQYGQDIAEESVWMKFNSPSSTFLEIFTKTQEIKIGDKLIFQVSSNVDIEKINYVILSRGTVVANGAVQIPSANATEFGVKVIKEMAPQSRILVYHILESGEVVTTGVNFEVQGGLQNKVNISFSYPNGSSFDFITQSVQPGSDVLLKGSAASKSFVGLLAVDQSVKLLKSGNDITTKEVLKELSTYNTDGKFRYNWYNYGMSGTTASDVLYDSGVVILTNGYVYGLERRYNKVAQSSSRNENVQPIAMASVSFKMDASFDDVSREDVPTSDLDASKSGQIRQLFPETLIWVDTISSENGSFEHQVKVPDTITSWIASAISVDKNLGIGIGENTASLRVFRPFFVSLNLPYSVIRGEIVHLQVLIFYYLDKDNRVNVTLEESEHFKVIPNTLTKFVQVKYGEVTSVSFKIIAKSVGYIDLKVSGRTYEASDTVIQQLLVKSEGVILYQSKSWFVGLDELQKDLIKIDHFTYFLPGEIEIISGSRRAELTVIGDIMGITLKNLGNLVRMPYGCGEQNMINFVPNILVLSYMSATNQLTGDIKDKAMNHLRTGYQRQLTYKRNDGSFSAFGDRDQSGSTWLTAFVLKSLHRAAFYIDVDPKLWVQSIAWLLMQQQENGSFKEVGKVIDAELQGGAISHISMTAYILISLLELKDLNKAETLLALNRAQTFLESEFANITDPYAICIVTYALTLAGSPISNEAFLKLKSIAQPETTSGGSFWRKSKDSHSELDEYKVKSVDVEMTSYALLTHLRRGKITESAPIIKWLSSQRNSNGGFQSTQDTVIGLQALASFAAKTYVPVTDVHISIKSIDVENNVNTSLPDPEINFSITKENSLILQSKKLQDTHASYGIYASGKGSTFIQLNLQYNVLDPKELDSFHLELKVHGDDNGLIIQACASHVEEGITGMVVIEIVLPSGYLADKNSFNILISNKIVQRVETRNGETEIIAYFNEIFHAPVCIQVIADKIYYVDNIKEVPVIIYEFYKPEKRTTRFYKP